MVVQSLAKVEYFSTIEVANQAIWLRKILANLGQQQDEATFIMVDNKSIVAIAKNIVQHGRTKYINAKFHVIREARRIGR